MNKIHEENILEIDLFHRIDINLYPLFISIYEQQSISKAAQILHISQSAVSHALQRLREHLKDDLFIRANRKMYPTPFAEQIYPDIKSALTMIQNISIQRKEFKINSIKTLKIAIHDEIESIIFPKLVQHFQSLNLNIQFLSSKLDRKTMTADLASQQIDFAIDLERSFDPKINFSPLIQDYFVICTQLKTMNQNIYFSSPHIGVSSRRTGMLVEDIFLAKVNPSRQIFLRCQHYSTALQVLEQFPHAILTIPFYLLKSLPISELIHIFEVPVDLPLLNIGMYWHSNFLFNQRHEFLKTEILKIFT